MAALAYDPKNLTFVANGQSYMLVRHFKAPDRANLPHVGEAAARKAVEAAVKANPGLAQEFNKTFSHNVGKVHRFSDTSTPIADAILQIQRKELHLLKLGPVAEIPKDVVAAAGGSVKTFKRFDFGDYARAGHAAPPPIPNDPVERLILIVQGLADLKVGDVGAKMWEKVKGLTEGRVIAALTTAFTAFVMAQLTGPAALLLDSALLGYGLYSLGTGVFQFADDLHDMWDRVKTARTRDDLKALSVALAVLLAEFAIERIIALLARGGKKKGGGGKEDGKDNSAMAPAQPNKPAPIPGNTKTQTSSPPPASAPAGGSGPSGAKPKPASADAKGGETRGGTYTLKDDEGNIVRTGRSNDLKRREGEHGRDPELAKYRFEPAHKTDDYAQQRGLEQVLHDQHNPPLNKVRPVSPSNKNIDKYKDAATKYLSDHGDE